MSCWNSDACTKPDTSPINSVHAKRQVPAGASERGFALLTVSVICIIMGIIALSNMRTTVGTEKLASNSIQKSRVFQAAIGGSILAERELKTMVEERLFADADATDGVFSLETPDPRWWYSYPYNGEHGISQGEVLGVKSPPRFIVEELGSFTSDGGTGISNLDRGSGAYGRISSSGRDFVLYRTESAAIGVQDGSYSIIETIVAESY